jgi:hypothetical protein
MRLYFIDIPSHFQPDPTLQELIVDSHLPDDVHEILHEKTLA